MPVQIGKLNQFVTLQKPTFVKDAHGGHVTTWSTRADVWAQRVSGQEGAEFIGAGQLTAALPSVWRIWFRTDVSVKDRLVVGTDQLQIESVQDPTGLREELILSCVQVQG